MQIVSFVMLLVLAIGCGKNDKLNSSSTGVDAAKKPHIPLNSKTDAEILELKYNGQITLYCAFRAHKGTVVDLSKSPASDFFWVMPKELISYKVLNYRIDNREMVAIIKLNESLKILDTVSFTDENQREFYMEHSPILSISFKRNTRSILRDGAVHERQSFDPVVLHENVEHRILTQVSETEDGPVVEDLRCTLMTSMNPQYFSQWQRIK